MDLQFLVLARGYRWKLRKSRNQFWGVSTLPAVQKTTLRSMFVNMISTCDYISTWTHGKSSHTFASLFIILLCSRVGQKKLNCMRWFEVQWDGLKKVNCMRWLLRWFGCMRCFVLKYRFCSNICEFCPLCGKRWLWEHFFACRRLDVASVEEVSPNVVSAVKVYISSGQWTVFLQYLRFYLLEWRDILTTAVFPYDVIDSLC